MLAATSAVAVVLFDDSRWALRISVIRAHSVEDRAAQIHQSLTCSIARASMARMLREASTQEIGPEVQELLAPVRHYVEGTVNRLARKSFKADPIVEAKYSRVTSIVSSAYKRHGSILERALVAALTAAPHLQVWAEPHFRVSQAAERLADSDQTALGAELPYGAEGSPRALQIDLLVYNRNAKRLGTYESKRGFGYHDSGKKRSMLRDLRCVHMLLRSYGRQQHGLEISESAAHMIFCYGQCSVGPPWALTRDDLDDHFQAPVVEVVEQINNYFRERLDELLAAA